MEILGKLLAGVGIFFSGLYMLNTALKQLTSRRLRALLAKWTGSIWQGSGIGFVLGAVVQSTTALSFILAGLVSVGMIHLSQAIPVILWANPGTCLLVVLAFLDINIIILFVLGIAGISYAYEKPRRLPALSQALFGLGLLFFGLNMIKTGALPLSKMEWFQSLLLQGQHSLWMSFVVGALLTMLVQSSIAIMILAITFTQSGVLGADQTIMIIFGAHIGSSILTWILASNLKGTAKQIVVVQVSVNLVGTAFMLVLFYLEKYLGIPLIKALAALISSQIEQQMSAVCTMLNCSAAVILTLLKNPFTRCVERFCPPTAQEEWSQMKFLHDQVVNNPETALEMARKEQSRLFSRFPLYLEESRKNQTYESSPLSSYHTAFTTVSHEVDGYLSEILQNSRNQSDSEQSLNVKNQQNLLVNLEHTLFDFSQLLMNWKTDGSVNHPKYFFLEGLEFILLTVQDAFENPTSDTIEPIFLFTGDRSELMQKMRNRLLSGNLNIDPNDRMVFLQLTSLYERAIWILGRIGSLLQQSHAEKQKEGFK